MVVLGMICEEVWLAVWDVSWEDVQTRKESGPIDWKWKLLLSLAAIVSTNWLCLLTAMRCSIARRC